jgi:hypothetical protein
VALFFFLYPTYTTEVLSFSCEGTLVTITVTLNNLCKKVWSQQTALTVRTQNCIQQAQGKRALGRHIVSHRWETEMEQRDEGRQDQVTGSYEHGTAPLNST